MKAYLVLFLFLSFLIFMNNKHAFNSEVKALRAFCADVLSSILLY